MPHDAITPFFQSYEQVLASGESSRLDAIYHESFLFGGPSGAQAVNRDAFLKFVPQRTARARSAGLTQTRLVSVEATPMDERYTLAKVVWAMNVEKPGEPVRQIEVRATYVLLALEAGFRVVAQFDHQDLMAELNR